MLKNSELDNVLEKTKELYSAINDKERLDEINNAESKIEKILKEEAVLIPISQPTNSFVIDKNIKNIINTKSLPNINYLYKILEKSYIYVTRKIVWGNKSIIHYYKYLFKILIYPNTKDLEKTENEKSSIINN